MSGAQPRLNLVWAAPGPVAAAFMRDRSKVSVINGPVGSGKSTAAFMKAIRLATEQRPSQTLTAPGPRGTRMPMRRFRLAAVRDTYRQLWRTTIPTWLTRVPRSVGEFTGAEGAPAVHRIPFALADGTMVEMQVDFVAVGDQSAEEALRGYEVTGFLLNELDLLAKDVLDYARTRTGRFPPASEEGASWHGIIADLNAPELHNWTYQGLFLRTPEELAEVSWALFRQPDGLSPQAENLTNLPPGYYDEMVSGAPEWLVRRMVRNIPGYSRAGKVIYPEFNDQLHVAAQTIHARRGIPLGIGFDAAGHPAAVFVQKLPSGQWLILRELVGEPGTGAARFGDMVAQVLRDEFPEFTDVYGWADPSAAYGADTKAGEATWIEIVAAHTGVRIRPAPTNKPIPRWEAVRLPLTRLIDGQPGLLLSPVCKLLRAGFNAEYRFRRIQGTTDRYDEAAEKNMASHPQDGLQYVLSGGGEDALIRERRAEDGKRGTALPRQTPSWDPYATGAYA